MITLLNAATASGAGGWARFVGDVGALIHVFSTAGASAVAEIQGSMDGVTPVTLATITNPSAIGEVWRGTALPYMRVNVSTYASGALSALSEPVRGDPGPWTQVAGASASGRGVIKKTFTLADFAGLGTTIQSLNISVGTLPAKAVVRGTHLRVDQAAEGTTTATCSVGVAGTAYVDWLVASDMKAVAGTWYGAAAAARGATNLGHLVYDTEKVIVAQVLCTVEHLVDLTACGGTVYVEYEILP